MFLFCVSYVANYFGNILSDRKINRSVRQTNVRWFEWSSCKNQVAVTTSENVGKGKRNTFLWPTSSFELQMQTRKLHRVRHRLW